VNLRTTIVLAILAAAGAAALWFLGPSRPAEPVSKPIFSTPTSTTTKLLDPPPDANAVTRVTWERDGRPTLSFERAPNPDDPAKAGDWRLTAPLASPGETNIINALVTAMLKLDYRSKHEPGAKGTPSPADAGLEPPQAVFTFAAGSGPETRIEIGRQPPLSNETWVRIGGKPTLYQVTRDFGPDLKRELKDYRGKTLLKARAADVTSLRITHDGQTSEFVRPLDGGWSIAAPVSARAEKQPLDDLAGKVVSLRATEFLDDAPQSLAPFGFDPPFLKIELTHERRPQPPLPSATPPASAPSTAPAPPETLTLLIGEFADRGRTKRYIKLGDQPAVATIMQASVDPLIPDLNKIRNPLVTGVDTAELTEFTYTVGGDSVTLTNADGAWRGAGDLAELDHAAVSELVSTFADLRALEFHDNPSDLAQYGLDAPRATLRARLKDQGALVTLNVGRLSESKRNAFVALEGVPTVFLVSAEQAERLVAPPLALRSRTIFAFQPEQIERLDLTRSGTHYLAVRQSGVWTLMEPPDCRIDTNSITQMVNDLARLRAKRVVAAGGDGEPYGLAAPVATFVVSLAAPATQPAATEPAASAPVAPPVTHRLAVGFRDNTAYCRKDDEPYIYELDASVYRSLVA
jgi:hypothetical protein